MRWARRGSRLRLAAVLISLCVASACAEGSSPPTELIDGSRSRPPPVGLERVDDAILTRARVVASRKIEPGSAAADCLARHVDGAAMGDVVIRVGVDGETVTFRSASGHGLYGCDNSAGSREGNRRWCGEAFGRMDGGRLRDPRLDLAACTTASGRPVAFAWVVPGSGASFIAVHRRGYAELFPIAGRLPVRITTTEEIDVDHARAWFEISEHDPAGHLLREYTLEARVAG